MPVPSRQGRPHRPRAERLDPEAGALLKVFNLAPSGSITRSTLRRQRLAWQAAAVALGHAEPVPRVRALRIPGPGGLIEARVYWPPSAKAGAVPAFLWFHGGAFLVGGIPTADTICRRLARSSGAAVVAVRYRLAPEHDLYAGRADCLAAVEWIAREGASLGIDTTRLAVGGDSAGGNLAAAVAQRCAERGAPALRLQVLVYPATNLRDEQASKQENARGYLLTAERIDAIRELITERQPDLSDPWLSPALSASLQGLPPALVLTAGYDPIRDDGLAYTDLLREAEVAVELLHYAGQFHGFLNFDGVLRAARDALDRIGAALRHALRPTTGQSAVGVDRTVELAARSVADLGLPLVRFGQDALLTALMFGERLERWRMATARRVLLDDPWLGALAPWLSPVTAWRARLGRQFAPIETRETYRRTAAA